MKRVLFICLLLSAFYTSAIAQNVTIFPKGEKAPNVNHVGVVWRSQLSSTDSVFTYGISEVAYEPGARLNWHRHPAGQILLITEGTGFYQEKGKPKQTVRKGDVVKCQPGVEHWHGATPQSGVTYIATTPAQKGPTVWLQKVTDEEYSAQKTILPASKNIVEQEIIDLSKQKWLWMADKNVEMLASLFHEKSKFVHMSGTWKKDEELDIIKTGKIWYKNAEVHDVAVEISGETAIVWNRITLTANVRGSDAVTEFTVTEVYEKKGNGWQLLALTFSSVRDTHQIKK